jgi:hypothetical protein
MTDAERVERLLRMALAPVEPPEALSDRLERGLSGLTDAAVEELSEWELSTMRDPRNWVRPLAAVAVGTTAGAALVVLRVRQQHRRRSKASDPLDFAERTLRSVADETRRILDR